MTQRLASIVRALGLLSSCALGSEHRANNPHGQGVAFTIDEDGWSMSSATLRYPAIVSGDAQVGGCRAEFRLCVRQWKIACIDARVKEFTYGSDSSRYE